jgi:hypothetical protein
MIFFVLQYHHIILFILNHGLPFLQETKTISPTEAEVSLFMAA